MALREIRPVSIYVATNRKNGKQYVGITSLPFRDRWRVHLNEERKGAPRVFARALRKYGEAGFDVEVVAQAPSAEFASEAERQFIIQLRPAYNMTSGGEGTRGLHPFSEARKARALKASWENPESRERRLTGMRRAAKNEQMQAAKGQRVSVAKGTPEAREKAREQSRYRAQADGGAQLAAARASRWAAPGARQNWDRSFVNGEYRARARANAIIQHAKRRGEIDLWLGVKGGLDASR